MRKYRSYLQRTLLFLSIALLSNQGFGQTRVKTMFYNHLNYSNDAVGQQKTPFLQTVLDEVNPDLFMVCELISESGSDYMFNNAILPHNADFDKASFEINQFWWIESATNGLLQHSKIGFGNESSYSCRHKRY